MLAIPMAARGAWTTSPASPCDRHEYHAGYAPTGKLDEKGKPETATVWKVVPGHEGHIANYGYANYHTPGERYDAYGYRI